MTASMSGSSNEAVVGYKRVSDMAELCDAVSQPCEEGLMPILYETETPLGDMTFDFPPSVRPLWVYAHTLGRPATWIRKRREFLDYNLFVLLSDSDPFSFSAARILSSLGIPCGLRQECAQPDWDAWADLLGYAAYAVVPHAPIEPFTCAIHSYRPDRAKPFCMDALTILKSHNRGLFVSGADSPDLDNASSREPDEAEKIDQFFIERHSCSFCPAWRVCMGTYEQSKGECDSTCSTFFREWMEACECPVITK